MRRNTRPAASLLMRMTSVLRDLLGKAAVWKLCACGHDLSVITAMACWLCLLRTLMLPRAHTLQKVANVLLLLLLGVFSSSVFTLPYLQYLHLLLLFFLLLQNRNSVDIRKQADLSEELNIYHLFFNYSCAVLLFLCVCVCAFQKTHADNNCLLAFTASQTHNHTHLRTDFSYTYTFTYRRTPAYIHSSFSDLTHHTDSWLQRDHRSKTRVTVFAQRENGTPLALPRRTYV